MSDPIDKANEDQQFLETINLTKRRETIQIQWNGVCHYCEESVEAPKLYCSGVCAEAHDKQLNRF